MKQPQPIKEELEKLQFLVQEPPKTTTVPPSKQPWPSPEKSICPTCKFPADRPGFIKLPPLPGEPSWKSRLTKCPDCYIDKMREQRTRQVRAHHELDMIVGWKESASLDNFYMTDENRAAYQAALDFVADPSGWLTLWGDYGRGKSHLLAAIRNDLMRVGVPALYTTAPEVTSALRNSVKSGRVEQFITDLRSFGVLLIDEVDQSDLKEWTREQVFRLFDNRWDNADNLGTVLAMSGDPNRLDDKLGYLFSRMRSDTGRCVYIGGPDNRNRGQKLWALARQVHRILVRG